MIEHISWQAALIGLCLVSAAVLWIISWFERSDR